MNPLAHVAICDLIGCCKIVTVVASYSCRTWKSGSEWAQLQAPSSYEMKSVLILAKETAENGIALRERINVRHQLFDKSKHVQED